VQVSDTACKARRFEIPSADDGEAGGSFCGAGVGVWGVVCVRGAASSSLVDCSAVRTLHFDWSGDSAVSGAGVNDVFCAERGVFGDGSAKTRTERFGAAAGLRPARKKQGRSAGLRNLMKIFQRKEKSSNFSVSKLTI
jgi:hypothetical protein